MVYIYLVVSCITFVEMFIVLDIKREAVSLIAQSRDATRVIMSSDLDDDKKEAFVRRASVEMFKSTFLFLVKFLAVIAVLYAIYWGTIALLPGLRAPIRESLVSPVVLVLLTLLATGYLWLRNVVFR